MGESRNELLAWLNDLTQLGYTQVEQCGTGAALCVIMDSIFRDVPLSKVKFNTKQEYEYVQNFKVLQNVFDKHHIDNAIPVQKLIKCKPQDNLEFLQWIKKYWDQYYPGGEYDASSRRKSQATGSKSSLTSLNGGKSSAKKGSDSDLSRASKNPKTNTATRAPPPLVSSMNKEATEAVKSELENEYRKVILELTNQVSDVNASMEQVSKEREFYFNKLREIEVYIQQNLDSADSSIEKHLKSIQDVLYRTEEGFEIPDNEEAVTVA